MIMSHTGDLGLLRFVMNTSHLKTYMDHHASGCYICGNLTPNSSFEHLVDQFKVCLLIKITPKYKHAEAYNRRFMKRELYKNEFTMSLLSYYLIKRVAVNWFIET